MNNKDLAVLARNHDNLMDQLNKKSVIGFADIYTKQQVKESAEGDSQMITMQEYLLQTKSRSSTNMFHSVESRGKNGYLVIYKEHLRHEVEELFTNMRVIMEETFEEQFIEKYFGGIQTHLDAIEINDTNSAVSTYSAGADYLNGVKSEIQSVTFDEDDNTETSNITQSAQSGKFQSRKRGQNINLGGYRDDVSSLGSKSTRHNAWELNRNHGSTDRSTGGESESVATLRTEVQEWLEELKEDNKNEWDQNIQEIKEMNTQMQEEFQETIQAMQNDHAKDLREQRDMFKDIIATQIKDIVTQTVKNQFEKQHIESGAHSPMRKQQKTTNQQDFGKYFIRFKSNSIPVDPVRKNGFTW